MDIDLIREDHRVKRKMGGRLLRRPPIFFSLFEYVSGSLESVAADDRVLFARYDRVEIDPEARPVSRSKSRLTINRTVYIFPSDASSSPIGIRPTTQVFPT